LTFGTLAKRPTSIFGAVAGERSSFETSSYLIQLCVYFSLLDSLLKFSFVLILA